MTKTVLKNPSELRMHATRKLLPPPAKERVDGLADAIRHKVKLPPIYVVEPNLVVAGWTRTLAHKQMQVDVECIVVSELEAEQIALGENTNRQMYSFRYQVAWIYMPLALWTVAQGNKRKLENLRKGQQIPESPTVGLYQTMDDIAERIGVSRALLFSVKEAYENIIAWDAKHEPCCWGDSKVKQTALEYCNGRILDPENPCTPGNAWAGVAGKQAAQEGKTKPEPKQLLLFCEGTRTLARWSRNFDKFTDDEYRKAVKSVKEMVAAMPASLREEVLAEIKRIAREQKGGGMKKPTLDHLAAGAERVGVVIAARQLQRTGLTIRRIGAELGVPWQTLFRWLRRCAGVADEALTAELLADRNANCGAKPKFTFAEQEAAALRAELLNTNQTAETGSLVETTKRLIQRGALRPELAEFVAGRLATGKAPLTPGMLNQVRVNGLVTRASRAPRNAWLDAVQSPGSLQMKWDDVTGASRLKRVGEELTMDDGTINFACCVPIERPGDKCYDKFGVCVGRWQFILPGDTRSYFIPGFSYTARPRSSYRAEDLLATWQTVFIEHGVPPTIIMEKGISAATLIARAMQLLGVKLSHANSPHQKVVEAIFNNLWTRLSGMPGQVGRFMGEEEEANRLLQSCRAGHTDPRKHFPMLADVLSALRAAIADWNAHKVVSRQYGEWIPQEWFAREAKALLRPLAANDAWMFAPVISPALLIRGLDVRTTFNVMPGYSMQFNFSAPWFVDYYGARVHLHYNPHRPECEAMVVLAEPFQGEAAGTVLGPAVQMNWHTRHNRRLLGIEETEDIGLIRTRMNAQALRRSVISIRTDGQTGAQQHEARNGVGEAATLERGTRPEPATELQAPTRGVAAARYEVRTRGVSEEDFDRQAERLARSEVRAARASSRRQQQTVLQDE